MEESSVEARMTAMEHEFGQIREEWKAVAQAPIINGRMLKALRDTQVEHGRDIAVLRETQLEHGRDIAVLRETQLEHGRDIHLLKQGQHTIISMLDQLIAREN